MAQVVCDVSDGLRPSEVTVSVRDVNDRLQFLRVDRAFLAENGGKHYLPIGVVYNDPRKAVVLIELPHEGDSGVNRLWVRREDLP